MSATGKPVSLRQISPSSRPVTLLAATLVAAALAAGCGPPPSSTASGGSARLQPARVDSVVGLRPGDAVELRLYRDSTVTGRFQVDENGVAVFPILGTREVAGLTPDSLRGLLRAGYGEYYSNPVLDVTVLRRISILGSVKKPGLYPVDPTVSLSEALAMAGGMTPNADRGDIRLLRSGRVLREELDQGTLLGTTPIRSGDRIFVGQKSWFARNWQWIGGTVSTALIFAFLR